MYKHLRPRCCECLTVRQRWPEAPRAPVHSRGRLWGRQTGEEGKHQLCCSPAGRKEAAVPLLSLPDHKTRWHDVLLRGTVLSLAKEVSLLPSLHEVTVVNVQRVNTFNNYITTQETRGWLSCCTLRLRTVATVKDAWPSHSPLIIKHCFQILTTGPNVNYLNLISVQLNAGFRLVYLSRHCSFFFFFLSSKIEWKELFFILKIYQLWYISSWIVLTGLSLAQDFVCEYPHKL